jgi:hypothetical protein
VIEDRVSLGTPDPVDVCEGDLDSLVGGQINSCDACHAASLALTLLVLGVLLANDPDDAFSPDHLAVLAQLLDRGPYFHGFP